MTSSFWLGARRLIAGYVADLLMYSGALAWLFVAALALSPGVDIRVVPQGAMIQTPSGAAPVTSPPPCEGARLP